MELFGEGSNSPDTDTFFWLNCNRITFGLLPISLPSKLTISTLKQLRNLQRRNVPSTADRNRDRIRLGEWKKLAKTYCDIGPSLSEVLFLTFETLNNQSAKNQLIATRHELSSLVKRQHRQFMRQRSVHFGQFLIFLWTQVYFPKPTFRETREQQNIDDSNKNENEPSPHNEIFDIFKKYINDILFLLSDVKGSLKSKNLDRLGYFISSGSFQLFQDQVHYDQEAKLSTLFPFWGSSSTDPSRIHQKVSIESVGKFICERLVVNSAKYPDFRSHFQNVTQRPESLVFSSQSGKPVRSRTMTFNDSLLSVQPKSGEVIQFCYGYHEETIVLGNDETYSHLKDVKESDSSPQRIREVIRIVGCFNSVIYILSPLKYLEVRDCERCTIIFSPVQKICRIQNCKSCQVIGISRILEISSSQDMTFNICVNIPPFLYQNETERICLGPYNTFYFKLEDHLLLAGLNPRLNHFQVPYSLDSSPATYNPHDPANFIQDHHHHENTDLKSQYIKKKKREKGRKKKWYLMPPERFRQFVIPFFVKNRNDEEIPDSELEKRKRKVGIIPGKEFINPCVIPKKYAESIQQRMMNVANTFSMIHEKTKDQPSKKEEVMGYLNEKFKEWLVHSENIKKINSLKDYKVDILMNGEGQDDEDDVNDVNASVGEESVNFGDGNEAGLYIGDENDYSNVQ